METNNTDSPPASPSLDEQRYLIAQRAVGDAWRALSDYAYLTEDDVLSRLIDLCGAANEVLAAAARQMEKRT